MAEFIELTANNIQRRKMLINIQHIIGVFQDEDETWIGTSLPDTGLINVVETYDEVKRLIRGLPAQASTPDDREYT